jgi:hypothetical protein
MIEYKSNEITNREDEPIFDKIPNTIDQLKKLFVRNIPNNDIYIKRLDFELEMLERKNLISHLFQAMEILNITKNIKVQFDLTEKEIFP